MAFRYLGNGVFREDRKSSALFVEGEEVALIVGGNPVSCPGGEKACTGLRRDPDGTLYCGMSDHADESSTVIRCIDLIRTTVGAANKEVSR